jgi:hypothetical protein
MARSTRWVLSNNMARSFFLAPFAAVARSQAVDALYFNGSLYAYGALGAAGSLLNAGALRLSGSLVLHGALT